MSSVVDNLCGERRLPCHAGFAGPWREDFGPTSRSPERTLWIRYPTGFIVDSLSIPPPSGLTPRTIIPVFLAHMYTHWVINCGNTFGSAHLRIYKAPLLPTFKPNLCLGTHRTPLTQKGCHVEKYFQGVHLLSNITGGSFGWFAAFSRSDGAIIRPTSTYGQSSLGKYQSYKLHTFCEKRPGSDYRGGFTSAGSWSIRMNLGGRCWLRKK